MKTFLIFLKLSVLLLSLLFFSSCGILQKRIKTITKIQIDTVFKYVPDTSNKIVSVTKDSLIYLYDTLKVENDVSKARAYYNIKTQKVELSLKGKIIDVPVKINATEIKKEMIPKKSNVLYFCSVFFLFFVFFYLFLIFKLIK